MAEDKVQKTGCVFKEIIKIMLVPCLIVLKINSEELP